MLTAEGLQVAAWVQFCVAMASMICSVLTIAVIVKMQAWNGYILLILSMVLFQMIYDVNFLLFVAPGVPVCVVWNFLDIVGGLGVSLWTNCISIPVLYIISRTKSLNIFHNYFYFFTVAAVLPFVLACISLVVLTPNDGDDDLPFRYCKYMTNPLASAISDIYYSGRILSIVFNIVVFLYITWRMRRMNIFSLEAIRKQNLELSADLREKNRVLGVVTTPESDSMRASENQFMAISTLVSRMKYYPIAQVLSRSGGIWNEFDNYKYSSNSSCMMHAITGPMLGVFSFLIFLIMQPKARKILYNMVTCSSDKPELPNLNFKDRSDSFMYYGEDELDDIINEGGSLSSRNAAEYVMSEPERTWASELEEGRDSFVSGMKIMMGEGAT